MLAVPVDAAVTPAPEPVDAVCTVTLGHSLAIWATQALNSGNKRLEPVSCRVTADVGQFSRLAGVAAATVVVGDEADVVVLEVAGVELQAAASRATGASTTRARVISAVGRRVGIAVLLLCHRLRCTGPSVRCGEPAAMRSAPT